MAADTPADPPQRQGYRVDLAMRIGVALVGIGALATIATLLPLFLDLEPLPVAAYLMCFLAPLGLAVILGALWQRARTRRTRLRPRPPSHLETPSHTE